MKLNLFNKDIILKETHCTKNNSCNVYKVDEPYVNIYVRIENSCNAKCLFCEFRGRKFEFDIHKLYFVLTEIRKKVRINKLSFTGGEPTLDVDLLKKAIDIVKLVDKDIFVVVNTNGVNLSKLANLGIDSIALSRHHYNDAINSVILGFVAPSIDEIKSFPDKEHLHLSCNLVKGYIDNENEIIKYLEFCNEVGVADVGLVSLMKVNDFCREHHIDFADLDFSSYKDICKNKTWNNGDCCRCANYLYICNSGNIVKMYSRYYSNSNNVESQLVFDGNVLKNGFNGEILI